MKFRKCPKCELNYITENETMCAVCRKALSLSEPDDLETLCMECGSNPALPGEDFCQACLNARKRREQEDNERDPEDETEEDDIEMTQSGSMDELELDMPDDIPDTELAEIENNFEYDEDGEEETEEAGETWNG